MKRILFFIALTISYANSYAQETEANAADTCIDCHIWSYSCADKWPAICSTCAGAIQSPVNIDTRSAVSARLPAIIYRYDKFSRLILKNDTHHYSLYAYLTGNNSILYNGVTYYFKQLHMHTRSEHTIDNKPKPLEIHLVHQDKDNNYLVIALWVDTIHGVKNKVLDPMFLNWPLSPDKYDTTGVIVNLLDLIPRPTRLNNGYYTYMGSLTTPACTQGVAFLLIKEPAKLSPGMLHFYRTKYNNTYRPTQPLNNRLVFSSAN
jgi:carbonic anhydrase